MSAPGIVVDALYRPVAPNAPVILGVDPNNNSRGVAVDLMGKLLTSGGGSVPGFNIPAYDSIVLTFYGPVNNPTNNLQTVVYKTGGISGATVATLTLSYKNGGTANNDTLATITKS